MVVMMVMMIMRLVSVRYCWPGAVDALTHWLTLLSPHSPLMKYTDLLSHILKGILHHKS